MFWMWIVFEFKGKDYRTTQAVCRELWSFSFEFGAVLV